MIDFVTNSIALDVLGLIGFAVLLYLAGVRPKRRRRKLRAEGRVTCWCKAFGSVRTACYCKGFDSKEDGVK